MPRLDETGCPSSRTFFISYLVRRIRGQRAPCDRCNAAKSTRYTCGNEEARMKRTNQEAHEVEAMLLIWPLQPDCLRIIICRNIHSSIYFPLLRFHDPTCKHLPVRQEIIPPTQSTFIAVMSSHLRGSKVDQEIGSGDGHGYSCDPCCVLPCVLSSMMNDGRRYYCCMPHITARIDKSCPPPTPYVSISIHLCNTDSLFFAISCFVPG